MRIVLVEWEDSSGYPGWHRLSKDDCISNCISIGVLVKEDSKQVVVISSKSDSGNIGDSNAIPKSCIKRIRYLGIK